MERIDRIRNELNLLKDAYEESKTKENLLALVTEVCKEDIVYYKEIVHEYMPYIELASQEEYIPAMLIMANQLDDWDIKKYIMLKKISRKIPLDVSFQCSLEIFWIFWILVVGVIGLVGYGCRYIYLQYVVQWLSK